MNIRSKVNRYFMRIFPAVHQRLYRWTSGRIGGSVRGGRLLMLTTTGRKTGKRRTTPVMFVEQDDHLMVIASNAGLDTQPGWYWNLRADPQATVQVGGVVRPVTARFAQGDERSRLWEELIERYPGYADYQQKTQREIPVVLLTPTR